MHLVLSGIPRCKPIELLDGLLFLLIFAVRLSMSSLMYSIYLLHSNHLLKP